MRMRRMFASGLNRLRSWGKAVTARARLENEMDTELADHLARLTDDLIRAGQAPAEAARRARITLGTSLTHKEKMRASLGLGWWDAVGADLKFALRMLRKNPGFTAIGAASLALAIGANATIFSVAMQLLYERLNVPHAANLRLLAWTSRQDHEAIHHVWGDWNARPGGQVTSTAFSYPAYEFLRSQNSELEDLFAFKETGMNATVRAQAMRVQVEMVSGNYYSALQVRPQLGRAIQQSDAATAGAGAVAVISDGVWERMFGRSPAALGELIKVNDTSLTIVGVNPRGFTGAKNVQQSPDVFVPLSMQPLVHPVTVRAERLANAGQSYPDALSDPNFWWVNVMGRVKPGVKDATAQAALNTQLAAEVRATMPLRPGDNLPNLDLRDGSRGLFEQERMFAKPMTVLMTMVGFVLLLACANIANLMLARGTQRQREMSVRMALGAGRVRILRQMLIESVVLAAIGGAGGLVMAFLGRDVIPKVTENAWERPDFHVAFDWKVFAFTAAVTLLTGLLFGMAPALAAARAEVAHGLKETAQTATRRRKGVGGKVLVGIQIALSTLLVIGAGLFLRTLAGLSAVDPGFRTDHLLLAEVNPPATRYPAEKGIEFHMRLEQAIAAVPGVESAAPAENAYLSDDSSGTDFIPEGVAFDPKKNYEEDFNVVGAHFFETLGIRIVAGRGFGTQDTAASEKVGVINESLARKWFAGRDPVGRRFRMNGGDSDGHAGSISADWIRIVGVCDDTRYLNLRELPPPQFMLPYTQQPDVGGMVYEIRTRMTPDALLPGLRRVVRGIDPDLPLVNVRTQQQQIDSDLIQERVFVTLTSGFGLLALALASVGIYGVMAYSVANRTSEIGIRLALGAQPAQVRGMILSESTWIAGAGIAVGAGAALLLSQAVKSMLYGIAPNDPLTMASGVALLLGVALAASWIPARRAAGVEPVVALRHE